MGSKKEKNNFGLIMAVYLLGIFMGALDTGIVTPARTVIQNSLNVDDSTGIWMITIYTLAYAASIPVMGKLADRMGRRTVYLISILLFGAGSLACGLSHGTDSFTFLLLARAVQAIGGGGIVPIANAEFGTTFPVEKRGMALGMVGGVYGIANIFGASAGSLVLDIFGTDRWEFIFYVNVPIAVFILIAGYISLPNTKDKTVARIDGIGTCILVIMVLCIMYGLKNIDFFDFKNTIASTDVYPYLLGFAVLLPFFIFIERKAEDPVLNLKLFSNLKIVITLVISLITGIVMMGVVFIPQLCENAMEVPTGDGGYFVIALGITAGVGAMSSGKMTDKMGPKIVLAFGFLCSIAGALVIIFRTTQEPSVFNVFLALALIGLSIGFTMGAPLNYMMLGDVDKREANSALATLSLVRSLGTVVAPAIMVGFIVQAGVGISDNIMNIMPDKVSVPELPYAQELTEKMKEQGVKDMPDLTSMNQIDINMDSDADSDFEIPDEILEEMQNSDVTTITESVCHMSTYFFDEMRPDIEKEIYEGIDKGIDSLNDAIKEMDDSLSDMDEGRNGIQQGIDKTTSALEEQQTQLDKMKKGKKGIKKGYDGIGEALAGMKKGRDEMSKAIPGVQQGVDGISKGIEEMKKGLEEMEKIPENPEISKKKAELKKEIEKNEAKKSEMEGKLKTMKSKKKELDKQIKDMEAKQAKMKSQMDDMDKGISGISEGMDSVENARAELKTKKAKLEEGMAGINTGKAEAEEYIRKMKVMKKAVPDAFDSAQESYIKAVKEKDPEIRKVFQSTLGEGFRNMFIMTGIAALVGIILLMLYRKKREDFLDESDMDIR